MTLLSHYVYRAPHNAVNTWLVKWMAKNRHSVPDLFTPDGFVSAQMICHALAGAARTPRSRSPRSRAGSSSRRRASSGSARRTMRCCSRCSRCSSFPGSGGHFAVKVVKTVSPGQRPASGHAVQVTSRLSSPILATRNLGLDIGGARIVADVSLEVAEGELLGIIGPNGAGKTSLFNLLSGLYRPTAGSIHLARKGHHPPGDLPPHARGARAHVSGLERLPAPDRGGERPARGRGVDRRDAPSLARA